MTVERAKLVEWWPLVDVAKLDVREGDVLVVTPLVASLIDNVAARAHMVRVLEEAMPGVRLVVAQRGYVEFVIKRRMPEMRAEDLDQPKRQTTMER